MKSNRGSISIFMLLIVPVIAIGIFLIYDYLRIYKMDNQVLKNVRNISEVQLANNNAHLFANYGILSYLDQNIIDSQLVALNDHVSVLNTSVDHFSLSDQTNFIEATKMASQNMIAIEMVNQIKALLTPYLKNNQSNDLLQLMKKFEQKAEMFFDFQKEIEKIEKMMTSQPSNSVFKSIEDVIEAKLNDVIKSYEVLLQSETEYARAQIQKYETLRDEAVRVSAEWTERITDLKSLDIEIARNRQEIKELKSQIGQINLKLDDLLESDDEWNGLTEELLRLKSQKTNALHHLSVLEEKWNNSIEAIIEDNKNIKPTLLDKIGQLTSKIDEMLFNLEPVENLTLPSVRMDLLHFNREGSVDMNFLEGFIYDEYWMGVLKSFDKESIRNFNPLATKRDRESVINGEVEFLIAGQLSDLKNVQIIKLRLLSIRAVANMLHIASDASKISQISRMTAPLPMPWNGIAHSAIVTLWSSAEGYLDTIALFKGEGHHFIKKEEEWQLSLDNLMQGRISSASKINVDKKVQPPDSKLYYQDYLRIMLYVQAKEITAKRGMFLLDANVRNASDERFDLEQFSIGHKIELSYMIKGLNESQSVMSMVNKY